MELYVGCKKFTKKFLRVEKITSQILESWKNSQVKFKEYWMCYEIIGRLHQWKHLIQVVENS